MNYTVSIIVRHFESPYYSRQLDALITSLDSLGIAASVKASKGTEEGEIEAFSNAISDGSDGVIIISESSNIKHLNALITRFSNTLIVGPFAAETLGAGVCVDDYTGGHLAADFLLSNGHERIAMVTGPSDRIDAARRTLGFTDRLAESTLDVSPPLLIESNFHESGGAAAMVKLLEHRYDFSAIFFHNDVMALGALSVCRQHGIEVPSEISIMGYDDITASRYSSPTLTTVHQPLQESGECAAKRLISLIQRPQENTTASAQCEVFTPSVQNRESVGSVQLSAQFEDEFTNRLSQREFDCLQWSARGKTSWETSMILGISESTVVFHLRNCGDKLNTNNRVHTVAKAIKLGLIGP